MTEEHRILLVDDDLADRLLARQSIRRAARALDAPVTLREAHSGPEALEMLASFSPTLMLVDLRMPAMDGFELIQRLRERSDTVGVKMVVLSTSAAPRDRSEAERLGCDGYIVKPLRPDDLTTRLQQPAPAAPAAPTSDTLQYRALLQELSDIAVLVFDQDLRYRLADGAALSRHGWSEARLLGRTLDDVFPPTIAERLRPLYQAALAGQRTTYAYTDTDGNHYEVLTRPVPAKDGPRRGMLLIREVTTLRRAEAALDAHREQLAQSLAQLEEVSQEAAHWARFASHDIAALLRQVVSSGGLEPEERDAFFSAILPAAQETRGRLGELLRYHEASHPLLRWASLDITALFAEVRQALAEDISASGASVGCDPMPRLSFDPDVLRQILTALLGNALSRARPGQPLRIWLSSRAVDGGTALSLADTGASLNLSQRVALFAPRWELGGAALGVDLATSRRLLDAVGGWIRATETPGGGLTVSFLVPHPPAEA